MYSLGIIFLCSLLIKNLGTAKISVYILLVLENPVNANNLGNMCRLLGPHRYFLYTWISRATAPAPAQV